MKLSSSEVGIECLVRTMKGRDGIIMIDNDGKCPNDFTPRETIHGWIEYSDKAIVHF